MAVVSGKTHEVVDCVFVVESNRNCDVVLSKCRTLNVDSETCRGFDVSQSGRKNILPVK